MRGSVFVKLKVWIVNRDGTMDKRTVDVSYGHSSVGEMNSNSQREDAFNRARNQALKQYRNSHKLNSDTEINYLLMRSGIINKRIINGKQKRQLKSVRISPARKRQLHHESMLGKDRPLTKQQYMKQFDMSEQEYKGRYVEQYTIDADTGKTKTKIKKPKRIVR